MAQMTVNQVGPLRRFAEQDRIVANVDALMALCDRLEASFNATAVTRPRSTRSRRTR